MGGEGGREMEGVRMREEGDERRERCREGGKDGCVIFMSMIGVLLCFPSPGRYCM